MIRKGLGNTMDDVLELGGNIELLGFSGFDAASMVILKKIIGNYGKNLSGISSKFEKLSVAVKFDDTDGTKRYEVHAKLMNDGKPFAAEVAEKNLFVAVDNALKKIASQFS